MSDQPHYEAMSEIKYGYPYPAQGPYQGPPPVAAPPQYYPAPPPKREPEPAHHLAKLASQMLGHAPHVLGRTKSEPPDAPGSFLTEAHRPCARTSGTPDRANLQATPDRANSHEPWDEGG
ncbi:unnamed protein product [Lupinus luteus]|uniref:Uncharacterized protein n=1 Tax=Lupinus luteus TaxID=3873 RepID=A0AAV1WXE6_LUPLU